jgi:adenosylcobinamide-GDP ribazoletransferase
MARFALGVAGIAVLTTGNAGLVVVVAMAGIALVTGHKAKARIGGQTGDVLGAAQLLSETAGWIALSLVL